MVQVASQLEFGVVPLRPARHFTRWVLTVASICVSNESCATTETYFQVACTPDVSDARGHLANLLTNSEPDYVLWRSRVGLSNVDPNELVLVDDDTICTTLWNAAFNRPPFRGTFVTFFQFGAFYFVTEYPGPSVTGRGLTVVVDEQFEGQGPVLAE